MDPAPPTVAAKSRPRPTRLIRVLESIADQELFEAAKDRRERRLVANGLRTMGVRGRWDQWWMACRLLDEPLTFTRGELEALAAAAQAGIAVHDRVAAASATRNGA